MVEKQESTVPVTSHVKSRFVAKICFVGHCVLLSIPTRGLSNIDDSYVAMDERSPRV